MGAKRRPQTQRTVPKRAPRMKRASLLSKSRKRGVNRSVQLRDVVGLYVDPPAHAIVLSVDEKSQIQVFDVPV
jgi:hypothetical protein